MKVLLTKAFVAADRAYIAERLEPGIELVEPPSYDVDGVLEALGAGDVAVLLGGIVAEPVLERAAESGVRLFQIPWTGVDTIDFGAVRRHAVTLCNSHSSASLIAEHAVALMLAAAKKIPYHDRLLRAGDWNRGEPGDDALSLFSRRIGGTRALVAGYGAIGQGIAQRLAGFDCRIEALSSSGRIADGAPPVARAWAADELERAVRGADWVFVALPLTDATRGLFDARVLGAMGAAATLVNVARGAIVDERALHEALAGGTILGAAIDTWYAGPTRDEPRSPPSRRFDFAALDNVVLSPHRAGYASGGFPHLDDAIENLNRCRRGDAPINVVSGDRGY